MVQSCQCGSRIVITIDRLAHTAGQWVTTKYPTATETGLKELRCANCPAVLQTEVLPADPYPSKEKTYNISIFVSRHTGYDTDASDLWFFRYMEYWFAQQGYTVYIDVLQSNEPSQMKSLYLNTDTLPDLMWSVELKNNEIVRYAMQKQMILDWMPYIDGGYMPNLAQRFKEQPESKTLSTAPNGGIYGIPYYAPSLYNSGCYGVSERLYFRQSWLDQAGVQNPTTKEELLNVLRAFKTKITDKTADKQDVPLVSSSSFLEKYLWTCMGFYGTEPSRFGTNLMIKDGEIVLPAYTESYKEFVTMMKTMYDEGLIAKDFFSYSDASAGALVNAGQCGALAWYTLEYVGDQFADIVCANPIPMGDVQSVEDIHVSRLKSIYPNYIWASSRYEEPRILAMLIDFIYSDEGAWLYRYGPSKAEGDPLDMVDGWYFDEIGNVTNDHVASGTGRITMSDYGRYYLYPHDYAGLRPVVVSTGTGNKLKFTDSVTGETFTVIDNVALSHDNNDGHWRLITIEKWSERATSIRLPNDVYLSRNELTEFADLKSDINNWINSETVRFITGTRPISELDKFYKELEDRGVERYLELARAGYADWYAATFD